MLNSLHKISCGNVISVLKTYKVLTRVPLVVILSSCFIVPLAKAQCESTQAGADTAQGSVYLDSNVNGMYDRSETGVGAYELAMVVKSYLQKAMAVTRSVLPPQKFSLFRSLPATYFL